MMTKIRNATAADLPVLLELLHELLTLEVDFIPDREKQARGLKLLLEDPNCLLQVAETAGEVVGFCGAQMLISTAEGGFSALIEDMVVHRDHRQRGIGRQLLEQAAAWATANGATRLQLVCDTHNFPAQKFYDRTGWKRTSLTTYFYFLPKEKPAGH